jgi:lysyl-tRNA synthetase class 2
MVDGMDSGKSASSAFPHPDAVRSRARILKTMRAFFDGLDFVEVETPVRIVAPAPETHIDCPPVATGGYLRASPELQMKKLLALGMERIYQIGPCFRDGEKGSRHHPEFTMIEWYRRNADCYAIMEDAKALVARLRGEETAFRIIPVREAYRMWAGWDPWTAWDADRFDFDMATKIEPALPKGPLFLFDYPAQAASLSKLSGRDPRVAQRWELYVDGLELANAFTELTDPAEQRARFEAARAERRTLGEADYPLDEEFLASLARMPPAGGVALGVDRLVMLACAASCLDDVRASC